MRKLTFFRKTILLIILNLIIASCSLGLILKENIRNKLFSHLIYARFFSQLGYMEFSDIKSESKEKSLQRINVTLLEGGKYALMLTSNRDIDLENVFNLQNEITFSINKVTPTRFIHIETICLFDKEEYETKRNQMVVRLINDNKAYQNDNEIQMKEIESQEIENKKDPSSNCLLLMELLKSRNQLEQYHYASQHLDLYLIKLNRKIEDVIGCCLCQENEDNLNESLSILSHDGSYNENCNLMPDLILGTTVINPLKQDCRSAEYFLTTSFDGDLPIALNPFNKNKDYLKGLGAALMTLGNGHSLNPELIGLGCTGLGATIDQVRAQDGASIFLKISSFRDKILEAIEKEEKKETEELSNPDI